MAAPQSCARPLEAAPQSRTPLLQQRLEIVMLALLQV